MKRKNWCIWKGSLRKKEEKQGGFVVLLTRLLLNEMNKKLQIVSE